MSSSGFTPIPNELRQIFDLARDYAAACDLYQRAHALKWRPFDVTQRSLMTRWDVSNRRVWSILETMERAGLLKISRGGDRQPSVVEVFNPCERANEGTATGRPKRRKPRQNSPGTPEEVGDSAPPPAPEAAPLSAPPTGTDSSETETETETETEKKTDWDRVHDAYLDGLEAQGRPRAGVKRSSPTGKALAARIRDHGADRMIAMLRWWATSNHQRARFLRENDHRLPTLTRPDKCAEYCGFAVQFASPAAASSATPHYDTFFAAYCARGEGWYRAMEGHRDHPLVVAVAALGGSRRLGERIQREGFRAASNIEADLVAQLQSDPGQAVRGRTDTASSQMTWDDPSLYEPPPTPVVLPDLESM